MEHKFYEYIIPNRKYIHRMIRTVYIILLTTLTFLIFTGCENDNNHVNPDLTEYIADLDVIYISRTPRYPRYSVQYNHPGTPSSWQWGLWPEIGTTITYTAFVKNAGTASAKKFEYSWIVDNNFVSGGTYNYNLGTDSSCQISYQLNWDGQTHTIEFRLQQTDTLDPPINNSRVIKTDGLSLRIHTEPVVYQQFCSLKNFAGTESFEDWIQAHIDTLNYMIETGKSNESVFIDEIVIEDNLPTGGTHAPNDIYWDGRWGFEKHEWTLNSIQRMVLEIDHGLIHELCHQIGVIDEYNLNFDWNYVNDNLVNHEVYYIPWHNIMNDLNFLSFSFHANNGLRLNKGKRRGFFGDYLYDVPLNNQLLINDTNGTTLKNFNINLYQAVDNKIDTIPEISGTIPESGIFQLPNRPVEEVTTPTGHSLKPNPFGQINVVGTNGLFLVEVIIDNKKYYNWLSIYRFNEEYWKGNTTNAVYEVTIPYP